MSGPYAHVKRGLDLVVSVPALLVTLPVQAVVAAVIRITMGRPVLFRQRRPGLGEEPFDLLKFRTMNEADAGEDRHATSRVTPVGRLLRATSLDELPSLWNVVRGDMSLVGPRPLLMEYLDRYSPEQARRHEVRPGVTGLSQVSGRNAVSWEDRLALDVQYVDDVSLRTDLRILARTVGVVFRRSGVDARSDVTMDEFRGGSDR